MYIKLVIYYTYMVLRARMGTSMPCDEDKCTLRLTTYVYPTNLPTAQFLLPTTTNTLRVFFLPAGVMFVTFFTSLSTVYRGGSRGGQKGQLPPPLFNTL